MFARFVLISEGLDASIGHIASDAPARAFLRDKKAKGGSGSAGVNGVQGVPRSVIIHTGRRNLIILTTRADRYE